MHASSSEDQFISPQFGGVDRSSWALRFSDSWRWQCPRERYFLSDRFGIRGQGGEIGMVRSVAIGYFTKVAEPVEVAVEYRVENMRSGRRRKRGRKVEIIW